MSSRGYLQWELVGEGADPVPASAYDVRQVAKEFSDQGAEMEDAARLLRNISNLSGWTGKAATQLADKAQDTHGDLAKAASKYVDAGSALTTFAEAVDTARTETAAAVADAVEADAQRKSNSANLLDGVDEPTPEQVSAQDDRDKALEAANSALSAARTRLVSALDALDRAAETAAGAIRSASENFKDSRMDDIKGFVSSALAVIVDALNVLAIIIAVVIVVLLIIGTGGAFLAFLVTAAFWVGAAIFALTAVQVALGDKGLGDLAWAALGLIGGGALSKGLKGASSVLSSVRAVQVARVTQQARDGLSVFVRLGRRVPFAPIRNWASGVEARAIADAVSAFNAPLDALTSTSRLLRGAQLDDMVTTVRQITHLKGLNLGDDIARELTKAQAWTGLAGLGWAGQTAAQLKDGIEVPQAFTNTIDNIGKAFEMMSANPPAGPISQPLGLHVAGAGR
jgi:hypothetical protein